MFIEMIEIEMSLTKETVKTLDNTDLAKLLWRIKDSLKYSKECLAQAMARNVTDRAEKAARNNAKKDGDRFCIAVEEARNRGFNSFLKGKDGPRLV